MGLFSRKKDTSSQEMELLGVAGQIATLKCLVLAGLKGISLRTTFAPESTTVDQVNSYQYLAQNGRVPTLTQGDFSVSGARAIMTYLDIRGKGTSLTPRKARVLGQQNYWIDICYQLLGPAVQAISDGNATDEDKATCNSILNRLNELLGENLYVVGPMTFADSNVAAYIYALKVSNADFSQYPNINNWITRLENEMTDVLLPMLTAAAVNKVA